MPEPLSTAEIIAVDSRTLETSPNWPGTYGFYVQLSRDPGREWAIELEAAYSGSRHPIKPPVLFRGDTLCVFFLPLYQDRLPEFLEHLESVIAQTNAAIEERNRALPDDSHTRETFRQSLESAAQSFRARR